MSHSARIAAAGISLPPVATPAGSYVPARRIGDLVMTSGQLPFQDGELVAAGIVGAQGGVDPELARKCARVAALNAVAAAAEAAGGLDQIESVVKVVGFVASDPSFAGQPGVINGASDVLVEIFGEAGRHARSAVGVAALPLGSPVEVEIVVALR